MQRFKRITYIFFNKFLKVNNIIINEIKKLKTCIVYVNSILLVGSCLERLHIFLSLNSPNYVLVSSLEQIISGEIFDHNANLYPFLKKYYTKRLKNWRLNEWTPKSKINNWISDDFQSYYYFQEHYYVCSLSIIIH